MPQFYFSKNLKDLVSVPMPLLLELAVESSLEIFEVQLAQVFAPKYAAK